LPVAPEVFLCPGLSQVHVSFSKYYFLARYLKHNSKITALDEKN